MPKRQAKLLLCLCFFFLFFFRPYLAMNTITPFDDTCYFERAYELFTPLPEKKCVNNFYFPGTSLSWAPLGLISKVVANFGSVSFYELFLSLSGLASFFFFCFSLLYLMKYFEVSTRTLLAFGLSLPLLPYVLISPRYAHGTEFLCIVLFCVALFKRYYSISFLIALFLVATRINDVPVLLLWGAKIADDFPNLSRRERKTVLSIVSLFTVALMVTLQPIYQFVAVKGYGGASTIYQFLNIEFSRVLPYFFKPFRGFLWLYPAWALILFFGISKWNRLTWFSRATVGWMLLQLWLCLAWDGQTSQLRLMGRYLTATFVPAFFIFQNELSERQKGWIKICFVWGAVYQLFFLWGTGTRFTADLPESLWQTPLRDLSYFFKYPFMSWVLVGISPLGETLNSLFKISPTRLMPMTQTLTIYLTLLCVGYCSYYLYHSRKRTS